jgi:mono/diheme cytochrome c family protein
MGCSKCGVLGISWRSGAGVSLRNHAMHAVVMCVAPLAGMLAAAEPAAPDFNRDIRPLLSENCFYCHGQDGQKREADLRLDDREAALAALAIVPGEPGASVMLERINSTDPDVVMPPPDSNRRLSDEQKRLLARWIAAGADYRPHWAFVPPVRPQPPPGSRADWAPHDGDSLGHA